MRIHPESPFDLALSLKAAASFLPDSAPAPRTLRTPVQRGSAAHVIELRQVPGGAVEVDGRADDEERRLAKLAEWLIAAELDLKPFYRLAAEHPIIGPIVLGLPGLKPLRPATLFEMAVIAITEQQLSLTAAFRIRARLIERFGTPVEDLWKFPPPQTIADASVAELRASGLSAAKARAVSALAASVETSRLTFRALRRSSDDEIRRLLTGLRGIGPWSAEYILLRGFGRMDCLPSGDVGLQRSVGTTLAGRPFSASELERALASLKPFRGLAAFYVSVHARLRPAALGADALSTSA